MDVIGIDEAGYGPNLGPLVVAGSVWRVSGNETLEERLVRCGAVARSLRELRDGKGAIAVADSKTLYKSRQSLRLLLDTILTVLAPQRPREGWTFRNLLATLDPGCEVAMERTPWDRDRNEPIRDVAEETAEKFVAALGRARLEGPRLYGKTVFPEEFNECVRKYDSKGTAHLHWVLGLVRRILERLPESGEPVEIFCDKLGARDRYAPFLYMFFQDAMIQTLAEGAERSAYRFSFREREVSLSFQVKGERFLPVALASVCAKLVRELAMQSFNAFWRKHLPELKETAGYPVDAKRFREEIASVQKRLRIDDDVFWRIK